MFVDTVKVQARAGKGGNGCIAFSHEPFKPKGGPCGSDGGNGGHVTLQSDHDINNLIGQYYAPHLHAKDGRPGEVFVRVGAGVADVNSSRPRTGIRTNVPIGVIRVVPDVLVLVTPPVFIALPEGVVIARSFLLVGPV